MGGTWSRHDRRRRLEDPNNSNDDNNNNNRDVLGAWHIREIIHLPGYEIGGEFQSSTGGVIHFGDSGRYPIEVPANHLYIERNANHHEPPGRRQQQQQQQSDAATNLSQALIEPAIFPRVYHRPQTCSAWCRREMRHRRLRSRIVMACFAAVFIWASSIAVCRAVVFDLILTGSTPTITTARERYAASSQTVDSESTLYSECVRLQTRSCNASLLFQLNSEVARCTQVARYNLDTVIKDSIIARADRCASSLEYAIRNLTDIQSEYCVRAEDLLLNGTSTTTTTTTLSFAREEQTRLSMVAAADDQGRLAQAALDDLHRDEMNFAMESDVGPKQDAPERLRAQTDVLVESTMTAPAETTQSGALSIRSLRNCVKKSTTATDECPGDSDLDLVKETMLARDEAKQAVIDYANSVQTEVKNYWSRATSVVDFFSNLAKLAGRITQAQVSFEADDGKEYKMSSEFAFKRTDDPPGAIDTSPSTLDQLAARLGVSSVHYGQVDDTVTQSVSSEEARSAQDHQDWADRYFSDYDPPPLAPYDACCNLTETRAELSAGVAGALDAATPSARVLLSDLTGELETNADRLERELSNKSYSNAAAGQWAKSVLGETVNLVGYGSDTIRNAEDVWNTILNTMIALDYMFRILHTLIILRSYILAGSVLVPPADVRASWWLWRRRCCGTSQTSGVRSGPGSGGGGMFGRQICRLATHPCTIAWLAFATVLAISSIVFPVYGPFVERYAITCRQTPSAAQWDGRGDDYGDNASGDSPDDLGAYDLPQSDALAQGQADLSDSNDYLRVLPKRETILSANMYETALHRAVARGDAATAQLLDDVNARREAYCIQNEDITRRNLIRAQAIYAPAKERLRSILQRGGELDRYVDSLCSAAGTSSLLTGNVSSACAPGGLDTMNRSDSFIRELRERTKLPSECIWYAQHSEPLTGQIPGLSEEEQIAVFRCERLAVCTIRCAGPDAKKIKLSTRASACESEGLVHVNLLGGMAVLFMFILLNASRYILFEGLRRVFVEYLAPPEYSYIATASEKGIVETASTVPRGNKYRAGAFAKEIQFRISQVLFFYKAEGYLFLLVGLCMNLPWIAFISYIGMLR